MTRQPRAPIPVATNGCAAITFEQLSPNGSSSPEEVCFHPNERCRILVPDWQFRVRWPVGGDSTMARKQQTFTGRLEEAGGVVALSDQTQQARAVLGLLPESAFDESDIKDGLSDLARYLFGEIVLQAKPLNRDDHDGIFDATDFDWSERLRALHSLAAPPGQRTRLRQRCRRD